MKKLKVVLIVFVALIVLLVLGVIIFLKTLDTEKIKLQITQQLTTLINRPVTIGNISFALSPTKGIALSVRQFSIADLPEFSSENFLSVKSINLDLDLGLFLSKRQILVSSVDISSPKINLIRTKDGKMNVPTVVDNNKVSVNLGVPIYKQETKTIARILQKLNTSLVESVEAADQVSNDSLSQLLIKVIHIKDGQLIFTDQLLSPAIIIPIEQISLEMNSVTLNKPFEFKFDGSLWSNEQNIHAKGFAQINPEAQEVVLTVLKVDSDLANIAINKISDSIPAIAAAGIENPLQGKIALDIPKMKIGSKGLLDIDLSGEFTDGKVKLKQLPHPIENIALSFKLDKSNLNIPNFSAALASGKITADGTIEDYLATQKFSFKGKADGLHLDELIAAGQLPVSIQGKLVGDFNIDGKGFNPANVIDSLSGESKFEVQEGKLIDVNILKLALTHLSFIPNLREKLEKTLPEEYKKKLEEKDTILTEAKVLTQFKNGVINLDKVVLAADDFNFSLYGQCDSKLHLTVQPDFLMSKTLSEALVKASEELSFLVNAQQQIHIPFKPYDGPLMDFRPVPDLEHLVKQAVQSQGKEELKNIIHKALGIEEPAPTQPTGNPNQTTPAPPQEEQKVRPEAAIIDQLLDSILK